MGQRNVTREIEISKMKMQDTKIAKIEIQDTTTMRYSKSCFSCM